MTNNQATQVTETIEVVEVRSQTNDNVVIRFQQTQDESINIVTAGYNKICSMLKINRLEAERRYYVTKA